jgi:hypothetical protein
MEEETGLPAVDPIIDGPGRIVDRIEQEFDFQVRKQHEA